MARKDKDDRARNKRSRVPAVKLKTVADYLAKDDVRAVLSTMNDKRAIIKDLIVIYTTAEGIPFWEGSQETTTATAVWMLEQAKNDLLNGNFEE